MADHENVRIPYRLPVTVVRTAGQITTVTGFGHPPGGTVTRSLVTTVEVRADARSPRVLAVPAQSFGKHTSDLVLTEDGRLTSAKSAEEVEAGGRWGAALRTGLGVAAAAAPIGAAFGPPGLAAALGVGALGGLATAFADGSRGIVDLHRVADPDPATGPDAGPVRLPVADRASLTAAGIDPDYVERAGEATLLLTARTARDRCRLALAQAALTGAASPGGARALALQEHSLGVVDRLLGPAEQAYAAWQAGRLTRVVEEVDVELTVDLLPTARQLNEAVERWAGRSAPAGAPAWEQLAHRLRCAVTVDLLADGVGEQVDPADTGVLHYRQPELAEVVCWELPAGGAPRRGATRRLLVTHPRGNRSLPLTGGRHDSAGYTFDDGGALVGVTSSGTGAGLARVQASAALLDQVKDAVAPLAPATRLADLQARQALAKLEHPALDPLAGLTAQVAEAELRAKLAAAQRRARYPDTDVLTASS